MKMIVMVSLKPQEGNRYRAGKCELLILLAEKYDISGTAIECMAEQWRKQ